jgi:hypothetical protein
MVELLTPIASQLDQPVQWTEEDGYPVALLTIVPADADGPTIELLHVSTSRPMVLKVA